MTQPCNRELKIGWNSAVESGSSLWNSLLRDITSAPTLDVFQKCLKTHQYFFPILISLNVIDFFCM